MKVTTELSEKEIGKCPRNFFTNIIALMVTRALMVGNLFYLNDARRIGVNILSV